MPICKEVVYKSVEVGFCLSDWSLEIGFGFRGEVGTWWFTIELGPFYLYIGDA